MQSGTAGIGTVALDPAQCPQILILPTARGQGSPGTQLLTGVSEEGSPSLGEVRSWGSTTVVVSIASSSPPSPVHPFHPVPQQ